ncbi:B-cell linker protein isoform X2 [Conger conger]|uniref:B-cell linker protein isoform X2 n=1 Tax=Conger conger TaxID=82655 RepID=UPI002A5B0CF4|nr:B-cell linker protein isoform X2 [Conger conger]
MSFLGKLKGMHSGPPAPPKRIDNHGYGWPEDEFEEDGYTYEAPPCERPAVKVPARTVEENVYLERSSGPDPSRHAPPPRPAKNIPTTKAMVNSPRVSQPPPVPQKLVEQHNLDETYIDPNIKMPPQINREEKPGKKAAPRKAPPSRPGPAPAPTPIPNLEDDVYLDPNEGQTEGSDELYLEPNAACPPPPGAGVRLPPPPKIITRVAPPPRAGPRNAPPARPLEAPPPRWHREAPPPVVKPPIPRALSSTHLPGDGKSVPPPEAKRPLFPIKPPPPGMKPHLPPPSLPLPSQSDAAVGGLKKSPLSGTEESRLQEKEWFAGNCDRKTAEAVLSKVNKDGSFLVRYSSAQNTQQPYTLVVLYRQKVYNIPIRYLELEHTQGYALGKEGKRNEEVFSSLQEIISHHMNKTILLIDSKSQAKHSTHLTHPVHP